MSPTDGELTGPSSGGFVVAMQHANRRWLYCLALGLLYFLPSANAAQVTLEAVADTSLWERERTNNLGQADILPAGTIGADGPFKKSRMLVKFNMEGLPQNAVIESATVYFRVVRAPDPEKGSNNSPFAGRRTLKDWGEGNKTYVDPQTPMTSTQEATAGEATWVHRFFGDDSKNWTVPGGDFTDDDFAEAASFEFFMLAGPDRDYLAPLNATGLQDLRDWLADADSNFGWVLKSEQENFPSTARQIASREYAVPAHRPQLTINYLVAQPAQPQILSITRSGNGVTIRYTAQANVIYRPQHRLLVNAGQWFDLPDQGPLANAGTLEFNDDLTGVDERYYRIVVP